VKTQDWKWLTTHREGQFFERKCCYDRSGKQPKRRDARSVARDVSETLAAMANADGEVWGRWATPFFDGVKINIAPWERLGMFPVKKIVGKVEMTPND